jgi:hypothetical protein
MKMTPAAAANVREALASIERAQDELNRACSALSPVCGLMREWERLGKLADKVKAEWHRLNGLDGPFHLDDE